MILKLYIYAFSFFITTGLLGQGFGSSGALDARNISLGGNNATSARGVYAIGVNPANLVINQDHTVEVSTVIPLPTINFSAGNDFMSLNDYKYFFSGVQGTNGEITGRYLNSSEKNKFLNLFDQGTMINSNFGISLFSFSFYPSKELGAFAFGVQDLISARVDLPKQIFELVLFGNEPGKVFDLNDIDINSWYLRNYSFTYSRDLSNLFSDAFHFFSAGITLKMVQGMFYAGVDKINTTLETQNDLDILVNGDSRMLVATSPSFGVEYDFEDNEERKESDVGFFNDPAGTGFGFDIGFYAELNKVWSIAFALTDLGSITWDDKAIEYTSNGSFLLEDITDETLVDSLTETISGEGHFINSFSTSLATAMKFGVGFKLDELLKGDFPGKMSIEFNYHQGFNNMPSNSTTERFALGVEWIPIDWFKFRTGISVGGYDKFNWATGIGFDVGLLDLDFATSYANSLVDGNNAKRLGFAMSSRWKF